MFVSKVIHHLSAKSRAKISNAAKWTEGFSPPLSVGLLFVIFVNGLQSGSVALAIDVTVPLSFL